MILLGFDSVEVDGVVAYPDHANPHQYWYLPANIHLATRGGNVIFTLIKYRPDAQQAGAKGGGFLTCEVNLALTPAIEGRLKSEILRVFKDQGVTRDNVNLSPVLYDSGKVGVTALDVDQTDIWTATSPSLSGNNTAILSLTLNQNQATLLDEAYKNEGKPVGVDYGLEFTAMRPALDVEVIADYKAIYQRFQAKFETQIPLTEDWSKRFKLDFETQLQWLQENQHLEIKVLNMAPDDPEIQKRKEWALEYVTAQLLRDFFVRKLHDMPMFPAPQSSLAEKLIDKLLMAWFFGAKMFPLQVGSLKLGYYRQEEQRKFEFRYTESKAVKQMHTPQSFFGTLLEDVPKKNPYYQEIDLDDPFFKEINIVVQAPLDTYGDIGLSSAQIILKYDSDQRDFSFDSQKPKEQKTKFNMNKFLDTTYQYQVQYYFESKSASGWDGPVSYTDSDGRTTEDRTLTLIPQEQMTFLNVAVNIEDGFDWNGIDVTKVFLTHAETGQTKTLTFTQSQSAAQHWKLRVPQPEADYYTYRVEYVMDGSSSVPGETGTTNTSNLLIHDPPNTLRVRIMPSGIDWNAVAAIEVYLKYEDSANHINVSSDAFVFDPDQKRSQSWSVRLANSDAKTYKWKALYYMNDGSEREYPSSGNLEDRQGSLLFLKKYVPQS